MQNIVNRQHNAACRLPYKRLMGFGSITLESYKHLNLWERLGALELEILMAPTSRTLKLRLLHSCI